MLLEKKKGKGKCQCFERKWRTYLKLGQNSHGIRLRQGGVKICIQDYQKCIKTGLLYYTEELGNSNNIY